MSATSVPVNNPDGLTHSGVSEECIVWMGLGVFLGLLIFGLVFGAIELVFQTPITRVQKEASDRLAEINNRLDATLTDQARETQEKVAAQSALQNERAAHSATTNRCIQLQAQLVQVQSDLNQQIEGLRTELNQVTTERAELRSEMKAQKRLLDDKALELEQMVTRFDYLRRSE